MASGFTIGLVGEPHSDAGGDLRIRCSHSDMRPAFGKTVLAEGRSQPCLRGSLATEGVPQKGGHRTCLSFLLPFPVTQDRSSPMAPSAGEVPRLTESLPATQDSRLPIAELTADSRPRRSILSSLAISFLLYVVTDGSQATLRATVSAVRT